MRGELPSFPFQDWPQRGEAEVLCTLIRLCRRDRRMVHGILVIRLTVKMTLAASFGWSANVRDTHRVLLPRTIESSLVARAAAVDDQTTRLASKTRSLLSVPITTKELSERFVPSSLVANGSCCRWPTSRADALNISSQHLAGAQVLYLQFVLAVPRSYLLNRQGSCHRHSTHTRQGRVTSTPSPFPSGRA